MYRILSGQGNPQLSILTAILENTGLRLSLEVRKSREACKFLHVLNGALTTETQFDRAVLAVTTGK